MELAHTTASSPCQHSHNQLYNDAATQAIIVPQIVQAAPLKLPTPWVQQGYVLNAASKPRCMRCVFSVSLYMLHTSLPTYTFIAHGTLHIIIDSSTLLSMTLYVGGRDTLTKPKVEFLIHSFPEVVHIRPLPSGRPHQLWWLHGSWLLGCRDSSAI